MSTATDLKAILPKVLSSGGNHKFFFAYGAGKRKDKKGEGELAVGGKKLKKAEIEAVLEGCKEFLEGVCWVGKGSNDSETVYFQSQGKKLSQMIVAKFALAAKHTTGRQFDFQVPSAEEEARAAKLKEGEDEGTEAPVAPTTKPEASAAPATKPKADKPATKPDAAHDPAAEYHAKLAEWSPGIKTAMASKGPHAADIAHLLAEATALAKPGGDMAKGLAKLTECHNLATKSATGEAQPAKGQPPSAAQAIARWNAERQKAQAQLQIVFKDIAASNDPEAKQAEMQLAVVIKQLNAHVETKQQAAEMKRYLGEDDVVADVCDLVCDVKTPLLALLNEMAAGLPG